METQPTPIQVRVVNRSPYPLPDYATAGAAGLDVCAWVEQPLTIEPLGRVRVPTGLYLEIPAGYEIQVRPRSGLAWRHGISLPNTPATIDSDYRGELQIPLINLGTEAFTVEPGMRIAQLVLARVERLSWLPTAELTPSERGEGGFGHSGLNP